MRRFLFVLALLAVVWVTGGRSNTFNSAYAGGCNCDPRVLGVMTKADAVAHGPAMPAGTVPVAEAGGAFVAYYDNDRDGAADGWYAGNTPIEACLTACAVALANR